MRSVGKLVFIGLLALAASCHLQRITNVADKEFLLKQMDVLELLHKIYQLNTFTDQAELGKMYDIEANINNYANDEAVKNFLSSYNLGMLAREDPFSAYNPQHMDQVIRLFNLFRHANDYDTFYKTACWARDRVNPGLFLYAFSTAVFHRDDMKGIELPPPYETNPYLFVDNELIQEAQKRSAEGVRSGEVIIPVNMKRRNEEPLTHFTEDLNLNSFYLLHDYYNPSWLSNRRTQQFYRNRLIYNRYLLERLVNYGPYAPSFDLNKPLEEPYNTDLRYHNGEEVPVRFNNLVLDILDPFQLSENENLEMELLNSADFDFALDLTSRALMHPETAARDPAFYKLWGRVEQLLHKKQESLPPYTDEELSFEGIKIEKMEIENLITYFEPYETSLENALYYNLKDTSSHRISRRQIENINYSGLNTSQYVYVPTTEQDPGNRRLNHEPVTYNVQVTSDKEHDVYVRVYLGPKYDYLGHEYDLNESRKYFTELDRFAYRVKGGASGNISIGLFNKGRASGNISKDNKLISDLLNLTTDPGIYFEIDRSPLGVNASTNRIKRSSDESTLTSLDQKSFSDLYNNVNNALNGKQPHYINEKRRCGFPNNLLLPRGNAEGLTFTIFTIVMPLVNKNDEDFDLCSIGYDGMYPDNRPVGFPFDRQIKFDNLNKPNMYFKDVKIKHIGYV